MDGAYNLERDGFAVQQDVLSEDDQHILARIIPESRLSARLRGILSMPEVRELACSGKIITLLQPQLPERPFPVRAIFFDKHPGANWLVSWHQDLTIAVQERIDQAGFGPWSVKDGVVHVQPPIDILVRPATCIFWISARTGAAQRSQSALGLPVTCLTA